MKKLSRLILIGIGALVGAIVILLLAVNLYVQSQATQARIQQELSQRLNTPLRIRGISVTPWGGLKLNGITIPQTQPGAVGDFLEAQTFRLRVRFGSLFAQRLVIKEVSLIGPNVIWIQNADGKWRLPESPRPAEVQAEVHEKPAPTAPAASAIPTTAPSRAAKAEKSLHHVCAWSRHHLLQKSGASDSRVVNSISSMAKEKSSRDSTVWIFARLSATRRRSTARLTSRRRRCAIASFSRS